MKNEKQIATARRFHNSSKELVLSMCEEFRDSIRGNAVENYAITSNEKNYFSIDIAFRDVEAVILFFHQLGARQMSTPAMPEYKELVSSLKNIKEFAERSESLSRSDKSFLVGEVTDTLSELDELVK